MNTDEQEFVRTTIGSDRLGSLDLRCRLLPSALWTVPRRADRVFFDDRSNEKANTVELMWIDRRLPPSSQDALVRELKEAIHSKDTQRYSAAELGNCVDVLRRLETEGNTAYPRVIALPELIATERGEVLSIFIGPNQFGVALVAERRIPLPTVVELRTHFVLNSLAVRVAVVYEENAEVFIEFHQRKAGRNATWPHAWDVGAAGYIDPAPWPHGHRDPEDHSRISPWRACAAEITEELNVPSWQLPNRERYHFYGLARNDLTGQLDILGTCILSQAPNPDRVPSDKVSRYGRCKLTPEDVARFVATQRRWVPTAILTLVLVLEYFGFSRAQIVEAFEEHKESIDLQSVGPVADGTNSVHTKNSSP